MATNLQIDDALITHALFHDRQKRYTLRCTPSDHVAYTDLNALMATTSLPFPPPPPPASPFTPSPQDSFESSVLSVEFPAHSTLHTQHCSPPCLPPPAPSAVSEEHAESSVNRGIRRPAERAQVCDQSAGIHRSHLVKQGHRRANEPTASWVQPRIHGWIAVRPFPRLGRERHNHHHRKAGRTDWNPHDHRRATPLLFVTRGLMNRKRECDDISRGQPISTHPCPPPRQESHPPHEWPVRFVAPPVPNHTRGAKG